MCIRDSVNSAATTIDVEISTEFLPGDTVSLSGYVVSKSDETAPPTVKCKITVESEKGDSLAEGRAEVSF